VSRADQDAFAIRSQQRAGKAIASGYFAEEITPISVPGGKSGPVIVDKDEHPRPETTLEGLAKLKPIVRNPGTVTAGNASGVNDGAAAMILASEAAVKKHGLTPRARILGLASAAVPPRIMGIGPVPATRKLMERLGLKISDFDLIELNEAFASQGIACLRQLGVKEDADFVNPHGGAIALGHPLGMSGARLAMTAVHGMEKRGGKRAPRHHVRRRRPGRRDGDREVELTGDHPRRHCEPTGRANARPMINSAKQSMVRQNKYDCFVASLLAMTKNVSRFDMTLIIPHRQQCGTSGAADAGLSQHVEAVAVENR